MSKPDWRAARGWIPFVLPLLAVVALYAGSWHYPLVFDDKPFFRSWLQNAIHAGFSFDLRAVSYGTFTWTYFVAGRGIEWYRVGNLLLHGVTATLLAVFFVRLYRAAVPQDGAGADPRWFACAAALLFALHPAAVYAVAYLVQRSTLMATLFGIAMVCCHLEGTVSRRRAWYFAAAAFYLLAVYAKEHAILLPAAAVALTLLLRRPGIALMRESWLPLVLYAAIGMSVVLRLKGVIGGVYEFALLEDIENARTADFDPQYALLHSILAEASLFFRYLCLWLVPNPHWMSVDLRVAFPTAITPWPGMVGLAGFAAYGWVAIRLILAGGAAGFAGFAMIWPWLLFGTEFSAVRYQEPFVLYRSYLWMAAAPGALLLLSRCRRAEWILAFLLALALALVPLARNRLDTFSSEVALWSDAIRKQADGNAYLSDRAYLNRGQAYYDAGLFNESVRDFDKAIALAPRFPNGYSGRGLAYAALGKHNAAMQDFQRAIELAPREAAHYVARCTAHIGARAWHKAIADCDHALALDPASPLARANRSLIDERMAQLQADLARIRARLAADPRDAQAYLQEGLLLKSLDEPGAARESFRKSCDLGNAFGCEQMAQTS